MHQYITPLPYRHMNPTESFFSLVVDDFGIKSTSESATSYLLQALRDKYEITVDPSGKKILGFCSLLGLLFPKSLFVDAKLRPSFPPSNPAFPAYTSSTCPAPPQQTSIWPENPICWLTGWHQRIFPPKPQPKISFRKSLEFFSIMESLWTSPC